MNETNAPKGRRETKIIKQGGLLIFLIIIMITIVIAAITFEKEPTGQPANVGLARKPLAYCAFLALENKGLDYAVSQVDEYDEIIAALKDGKLDAALLPTQYLKEFNEDEYAVIAVTSYMNLIAVENGGTVSSIYDLKDHCIVIPSSVEGMPEMQMLNVLLLQANIPANLVFENDEVVWQRVQDEDFDIVILPVEQCAPVLLYNIKYRTCFNLANQWNMLFESQPPAGSCIIMRNACIEQKRDAISGFLTTIKASIGFINAHHKKAAVHIADNGLGDDSSYIWKTIPHCMFVYLEDGNMTEPLSQLSMLTTTQ